MRIKLLLTGGTIDKQYNHLTAEMDYQETHIQKMLSQARSRLDLDIEELMLVDSLDITDQARHQILQACRDAEQGMIVITHGTDTMVDTAASLGKNVEDKTIVLTGSMVPFAFGESDALFNLGAALTAVQILDKGVYITMNGKIFDWDGVVKNRELGEFQQT